MFGGFRSRDVLGVDLSTDDVKLVRAANVVGGGMHVTNLVTLDIQGLSDEAVSGVIRAAVDEMNVEKPAVVAVISSHMGITRNIEVPSVDGNEVRDIVNLQASRHTPYSREDIIVDYVNMGVYKGTYTRVLLIVVRHDAVKRQLSMLEDAGLNPEKVLFGSEVISRVSPVLFKAGTPETPKGIIHIDRGSTDFIIAVNTRLTFVRSISIGAGHLIENPEKYRPEFAEEIKRSLDVYQTEEIDRNPDNFSVIGAVAALGDLTSVLDNALKMPTETVSYSRHFSISDEALQTIDANVNLSFLGIIASIHARREAEIDLVPDEVKARRRFEERTGNVIKTGVLGLIMLFLIAALLFNRIATKTIYLQRLTSQYQPIINKAERFEENYEKVRWLEKLLSEGYHSLDVLGELYDLVPDDIFLTSITFDRKKEKEIWIEGASQSASLPNDLSASMDGSTFFKEVDLRPVTKRNDEELWDFEIRCSLEDKVEIE